MPIMTKSRGQVRGRWAFGAGGWDQRQRAPPIPDRPQVRALDAFQGQTLDDRDPFPLPWGSGVRREWESCGAGLRTFSALQQRQRGWERQGGQRGCAPNACLCTPGFSLHGGLPGAGGEGAGHAGRIKAWGLWPWSGGL